MKVTIDRSLAEGQDGPWIPESEVPNKVLLEMDNGQGEPSGKPCVKIGSIMFWYGQPHENVTKFRVLALQTVVVAEQE